MLPPLRADHTRFLADVVRAIRIVKQSPGAPLLLVRTVRPRQLPRHTAATILPRNHGVRPAARITNGNATNYFA